MNDITTQSNTIYQFEVKDVEGNPVSLSKYKGKVILIVNTASKFGYINYCMITKLVEKSQKHYTG